MTRTLPVLRSGTTAVINRFNLRIYCGAKCWMLILDKQKMRSGGREGVGGSHLLIIDCHGSCDSAFKTQPLALNSAHMHTS